MNRTMVRMLVLAALAGLALSACGPEDGRAQGGGRGADIGNVASDFKPKSKVFTADQ